MSKERRIFAADFTKLLSTTMKKGLLYAILASVLWAIVNPFIKQGLSYDFTPMNFAGIRFYCCPLKLFIQNKLGLTLLTKYQPF